MKRHATTRIAPVLIALLIGLLCLTLTACGESACEHVYGEWTVTQEPTCTEDGSQTRTCTLCTVTETEAIPATGHEADRMICSVCETELLAIESLCPTVDPATVEGVRLQLSGIPTEDGSIDSMTLSIYPTAEGDYVAHGKATVTNLYDESYEMLVFFEDGTAYIAFEQPVPSEIGGTIQATLAVYIERMIGAYASDPMASLDPEAAAMLAPYLAMLEPLEAWVNEYLLPLLGDSLPTLPETPAEPTVPTLDDEALRTLIETYFTVEVTAEGATVSLDLGYLKELNATLAEMTAADLVERALGAGSLDTLLTQAPALLAFDVRTLVEMIETNSEIDLSSCDEAADALMAILHGEGATVESVYGKPLSALLEDEAVLATSVADVLVAALSTEEEPVTEDDLLTALADAITALKSTKLYDMIKTDDMPDPKGMIDTALTALDKALDVVITVDADGAFVSAVMKVKAEGTVLTTTIYNESLELSLKSLMMTPIKITVTYDPDLDLDEDALAAAKAAIVTAPLTEEAIEMNGFTAIIEDGTVIGAIYDERTDDMAYIDEDAGYALYCVYEVDLTGEPVTIGTNSYKGSTVTAVYGYLGTCTTYEFYFTPGTAIDLSTAEPTSVSTSEEVVSFTVFLEPSEGEGL